MNVPRQYEKISHFFSWSVRRTLERRSERIRAVEFIRGCEPAWVMGALPQAPGRLNLDGSPVLLGSTATHDLTAVIKALWAR
jgi:hypothetical protein